MTRIILTASVVLGTSLASIAQSFYSVSFKEAATLPLYEGYSNDIRLEVVDPANPCTSVPFEIQAEGGQVEYSAGSPFVKVLAKSSQVVLHVFVNLNNKWWKAGLVKLSTIKPDVKETSFKLAVGEKKPQSSLTGAKSFTPPDETVEDVKDLELWMMEPAMPSLAAGANRLKVYVTDEARTDNCTPQKEIELKSSEAGIKKLSRNSFEVTPNDGQLRCALEVFMDGARISTEMLQVRKK